MWFRHLFQKENKLLFKFCERTTDTLNIDSISDPLYSRRKIKMGCPLIPALNSRIVRVGRTGRRYYYFLMATSTEMFG